MKLRLDPLRRLICEMVSTYVPDDVEDAEWEEMSPEEPVSSNPIDEYEAAVTELATNWSEWESERPEDMPVEADPSVAMDVAQDFLHEHPEWVGWAKTLYMSKSEMLQAVADRVRAAMLGER